MNRDSAVETTFNQVPVWIEELSFRPGPPWLSMGTLGALRDGPLLIEDDLRSVYLAEKQRLFANAREVVSVSLAEAAEGAAEAAQLISSGPSGANPIGNFRPLEIAALQVQEDLIVLVRAEEGWRFGAGVVCFPSHWVPSEKLGLHVTGVHEPVPHYNEELAQRVDRFLDHLAPGRNAWRRNWMIHASPQLYVPHPPPVGSPVQPRDLWLRSERQVLCALPATGAILFTIRTQQFRLRALATRPDVASSMASSLRSSPDSLRAYRRHDGFRLDEVINFPETWANRPPFRGRCEVSRSSQVGHIVQLHSPIPHFALLIYTAAMTSIIGSSLTLAALRRFGMAAAASADADDGHADPRGRSQAVDEGHRAHVAAVARENAGEDGNPQHANEFSMALLGLTPRPDPRRERSPRPHWPQG